MLSCESTWFAYYDCPPSKELKQLAQTVNIYLYKVHMYLFFFFLHYLKYKSYCKHCAITATPWSPSWAHWLTSRAPLQLYSPLALDPEPISSPSSRAQPPRDSTPLFVPTRKITLFVIDKLKSINNNVTKMLRNL